MGATPSEPCREEKLLLELLEREDIQGYLRMKPTTRHEAWLLVSALANASLARELRLMREALRHNGNGKDRAWGKINL